MLTRLYIEALLVDSRRLFFARADRLSDPFEGSWPKLTVEARNTIPEGIPEEVHEAYIESIGKMGGISKGLLRCTAINCWNMHDIESAALWKIYLKSNEGIAIQSTYENLKSSLIDTETIYMGCVNYIDYQAEYIGDGNLLVPFVHKRRSFEHEREVRAIVIRFPDFNTGATFATGTIDEGLQIRIDLEILIQRVYVAPSSPKWLSELVQQVISTYGYDFDVVQSSLDDSPVF